MENFLSRPIRNVILPCEIKAREFDSKLLLACILAERGCDVYVGSRNHIHMGLAQLPRSIYLGKDVRFSSKHIARILRLLGHQFFAHDEEALIYYSREDYCRLRVDSEVIGSAACLFAWGPDNALAWRSISNQTVSKTHITGNGRIDLLREELRPIYHRAAEAIREKYGLFILINTNFGSLNHYYPSLTSLTPPENLGDKPANWEAGLSRHRFAVFRAFLKMLPRLAMKFPNINFVLRPHPGENQKIWIDAADGATNVFVSHEGSAIPWIIASQAMIHNGCTTGLEAYILGKIPLAFQPVVSPIHDLELPNKLSIQVFNEADLFSNVDAVLRDVAFADGFRTSERCKLLDEHVSATSCKLASDRIADFIAGWDTKPISSHKFSWPIGLVYAEARAFMKRLKRNTLGHKTNMAYTKHRFPDTSLSEVDQKISEFSNLLQRFKAVEASVYDENVFLLTAKKYPTGEA